jgi:TP901-1 family phage major tail protein
MPMEKGSAFLLKIGNGAAVPVFATIAGLRTTNVAINGEAVNVTTKDSGGWRDLLAGAGVRSVSVSAAGIFTGSTAEARAQANVLAGAIDEYELVFESGAKLKGRFLINRLEHSGDYNGERNYTLSLESSGPVVSL